MTLKYCYNIRYSDLYFPQPGFRLINQICRRNTYAEEVAKEIRSLILTGELKPGEYLEPQKSLADHYGVGLSTIRESIQLLSAVGMVESHPGKGTWVRQDALSTVFNLTEVRTRLGKLNAQQVYEARMVIEVALIRLAAKRAADEDIAIIYKALRAMEEYVERSDEFVQADLEFHLAVAKASHNQLLEQFYHLVRGLLSEVITEMVMLPKVKEESIILQKSIAMAIENHDELQAENAAQLHMQYIKCLLQEYS